MSEAVEKTETVPAAESSHQRNHTTDHIEPPGTQPLPALQDEVTGTQLSDDLFLGAGVCQTMPQSLSLPLSLPDYVPFPALQDRMTTEMYLTHTSAAQDLSLELPLPHQNGGVTSDVPWGENPGWRREDGSLFSVNPSSPNAFGGPPRLPAISRLPLQASSVAGSAGLNVMNGCLPQGTILGDASRSVRNGSSSVCTSQGWQRRGFNRREDLYRLSQNPWGPNTVFGPRSIPTDMHSWQIRNGDHSYEPNCVYHSEANLPYHLMRKNEQPCNVYSKYRGHHGIVRRVRKKIVDVGGRLCQSFFVWVLFVATLAGVEGFKEKSGALRGMGGVDVEWSDSEADSENESHAKFDVRSFKG